MTSEHELVALVRAIAPSISASEARALVRRCEGDAAAVEQSLSDRLLDERGNAQHNWAAVESKATRRQRKQRQRKQQQQQERRRQQQRQEQQEQQRRKQRAEAAAAAKKQERQQRTDQDASSTSASAQADGAQEPAATAWSNLLPKKRPAQQAKKRPAQQPRPDAAAPARRAARPAAANSWAAMMRASGEPQRAEQPVKETVEVAPVAAEPDEFDEAKVVSVTEAMEGLAVDQDAAKLQQAQEHEEEQAAVVAEPEPLVAESVSPVHEESEPEHPLPVDAATHAAEPMHEQPVVPSPAPVREEQQQSPSVAMQPQQQSPHSMAPGVEHMPMQHMYAYPPAFMSMPPHAQFGAGPVGQEGAAAQPPMPQQMYGYAPMPPMYGYPMYAGYPPHAQGQSQHMQHVPYPQQAQQHVPHEQQQGQSQAQQQQQHQHHVQQQGYGSQGYAPQQGYPPAPYYSTPQQGYNEFGYQR